MIEAEIGARIRELRLSLGESQEAFALRIGMSRSYFAEVERGRRNASMDTLARIFRGLGVSPRDFFAAEVFNRRSFPQ